MLLRYRRKLINAHYIGLDKYKSALSSQGHDKLNLHQPPTTGFTTELAYHSFEIDLKCHGRLSEMADQAQLASLLAESADHVSNLNSQLPVASPVSLDEFVDQCSNLIEGINPRSHKDPQKRSILVPKSRLLITPFQLWEAWKMLNQRERTGGLRGGLQASAAGTGKSFVVLSAVLLRARMFEMEREVKAYWAEPKKGAKRGAATRSHLPASAGGNGQKCPSQKPGDLVCYCVETSKARKFIDSAAAPSGVSLIQAPLPVVGQWISIFENAVLDTSSYNLVIVHSGVPSRLKRDFTRVIKGLSSPEARGSLIAPETYIFLSAHGNTKVHETFTGADLNVGIMFSDESHLAMRLESRSMAISEAQSRVGQGLDLWLVSATPIRLLQDFELPLSLFSSSSDLSRAATMANLIAAHRTARSSDENMGTFQTLWNRVFDDNLVLRNTVASHFCGKPITSLQVIRPDRVFLRTPQHHFNNVQAVAHEAREVIRTQAGIAKDNEQPFHPEYNSGLDARLHFVSLFPGAANLIRQKLLDISEESVKRSIDEMKQPNKLQVEKIARFQQYLEQVVAGSPKLNFIENEIRRIGQDGDRRIGNPLVQASIRRENLSLKKMVIVTPTLGTAVFLYLFLRKRMPDLAPALLHSIGRPADREAAINSFTSLTARKNAKHSYILITPFASGGTGLNLQSANYQILTSPLSSRDAETQCFARTNRTGQRLALHHRVLITEDNPADRINIVSSAGRSIRNDPFELGRRLVLFRLDGNKEVQRLEDWGYEIHNSEQENPYLVPETYPTINESEYHDIIINVPSVDRKPVDELMYFDPGTVADNTIAICEAWNDRGDTRPRHEKLPLRDLIATVWVHRLNRPLRRLDAFIYYTVIEERLSDQVRPFIYRLMGEDMNDDLTLSRDSESPQGQEAFTYLMENAPFCIGVQKMLKEYPEFSGIEVESLEFLPVTLEGYPMEKPVFNFRINLK